MAAPADMAAQPSRRQLQAQQTRTDILDAALELFSAQGYGATTIAEIARRAGVALPTVYANVGSKPRLLSELLNRIDELADVGELASRLAVSESPAEIVSLQVRIASHVVARSGPIVAALASAATVDPQLARAYRAGLERHREGCRQTAARLDELGALREKWSPADATAVISVMTGHQVFAELSGEFGWSFERSEHWLTERLCADLLR